MKVEVLFGNPPSLTDTDSDDETDEEEEESTVDSDADVYSDSVVSEIDECYTIELGSSGKIALQSLLMKLNLLFIFR